jgi:hypothetical protein
VCHSVCVYVSVSASVSVCAFVCLRACGLFHLRGSFKIAALRFVFFDSSIQIFRNTIRCHLDPSFSVAATLLVASTPPVVATLAPRVASAMAGRSDPRVPATHLCPADVAWRWCAREAQVMPTAVICFPPHGTVYISALEPVLDRRWLEEAGVRSANCTQPSPPTPLPTQPPLPPPPPPLPPPPTLPQLQARHR